MSRILFDAFDSAAAHYSLSIDSGVYTVTGTAATVTATRTLALSGGTYAVTGTSATGNIAWTFSIPVAAGEADAFLPPSPASPWTLRVTEGGYVNRSGRITSFRLIWHATGGDLVYEGSPVPQLTLEGSTVRSYAPSGLVSVDTPPARPLFRAEPNPAFAGTEVAFRIPGGASGPLRVFDVSGREVARVAVVAEGDHGLARWNARDAAGGLLPSGLYFGRVAGFASRVTVIGR